MSKPGHPDVNAAISGDPRRHGKRDGLIRSVLRGRKALSHDIRTSTVISADDPVIASALGEGVDPDRFGASAETGAGRGRTGRHVPVHAGSDAVLAASRAAGRQSRHGAS